MLKRRKFYAFQNSDIFKFWFFWCCQIESVQILYEIHSKIQIHTWQIYENLCFQYKFFSI